MGGMGDTYILYIHMYVFLLTVIVVTDYLTNSHYS